jgi:hypothetical protein
LVLVRYRPLLREHLRSIAIWIGGLAVLYACFGAYYFTNDIGSQLQGGTLSQTWTLFQQGMRAILSGTWFYDYALGPLAPRNAVFWIVVALFAVGAIASALIPGARNLAVSTLALATLLIAAQNVLTRQATAGWHYVSIYPFVTIVAAYGAYALAAALLRRDPAVRFALASVGVAAVAYQGVLMAKYLDALNREPANPAWSPAIYPLSNRLAHTTGPVFTADWGILTPLFALRPARRYTELAFGLKSPTAASLAALGKSLRSIPGPKLLVTHASAKLEFPDVNANLFKAARGHLHLISSVAGRDGRPVFLVYAYR